VAAGTEVCKEEKDTRQNRENQSDQKGHPEIDKKAPKKDRKSVLNPDWHFRVTANFWGLARRREEKPNKVGKWKRIHKKTAARFMSHGRTVRGTRGRSLGEERFEEKRGGWGESEFEEEGKL